MGTLAAAKRSEQWVGLGTPRRLRLFTTVGIGLIGLMVECWLVIVYVRAGAALPDHGVEWVVMMATAGPVPFAWYLYALRRLGRFVLSDDAEREGIRVASGQACASYVLIGFVLKLLLPALQSIK
jgi:hypothetical protein